MDKLRQAAQQALAQLEINRTNFRNGPSKSICKMLAGGNDEVIAKLRAALAEQPAEQEPKHDDPIGDAQDKLIAEQAARPYKVGGLCVPTQTGPCAEGEDMKGTCIRCGKPFNSVDDIHICTPPRALALAEQPAEQEPYCYVYTENGEEYFAPPTAYVPDNAKPLYTAPQPAKPAEQEPVAHLYRDHNGELRLNCIKPVPYFAFPVYTAPQPAKTAEQEPEGNVCGRCGGLVFDPVIPQPRREVELTDDAITHMAAQSLLYEENPPQGFDAAVRSFARAVIEAYKEKNT